MLGPVICRSVRRRARPSSTGAASPHGVPGSSTRSPPSFPPTLAARAGPQAGRIRLTQGAVLRELSRRTTSSSWPTTILNGANLLTASTGARSPLNPRTLALTWHAPSHPASDLTFPCLLRCRWWPPRHLRHFGELLAGLGRGRAASSATAAAAAAPRAHFRARPTGFRAAADRAETVCRGAPWVVGRTVLVSSC